MLTGEINENFIDSKLVSRPNGSDDSEPDEEYGTGYPKK